jgi:hypothetical protein
MEHLEFQMEGNNLYSFISQIVSLSLWGVPPLLSRDIDYCNFFRKHETL